MTMGVRLLLVTVFATTVTAADDAEFAFNLLSDVAPILALFGDSFAKQFMSESLTWIDHLLFAMVPLGIVTAIVAAIRVQGMQVAKAFVGCARQNRALAEIELMSSTSGEVCELFNGNSIVRAMGAPKIGQFLIFPNEYDALEQKYKESDAATKKSDDPGKEPEDKTCGIHSLQTATSGEPRESKLMVCKSYYGRSATLIQERFKPGLEFSRDLWKDPFDMFKKFFRPKPSPPGPGNEEGIVPTLTKGENDDPIPPVDKERALSGPPNLQLNLSSDHFDQSTLKKRHELVLAAVVAVLLQTGLIAVAAATAYRLRPGSSSLFESKPYGFPCYTAGSVLLSIGTGLCSFIVEHSTTELAWEPVNNAAEKTSADRAQEDTEKAKVDAEKAKEAVEKAKADAKKAKADAKKAKGDPKKAKADAEKAEADVKKAKENAKKAAKKAKMGIEEVKRMQNAPRLIWIQRYQTVNDQSFKGYVILAGPKRRVITSRRNDDSASRGSYSSGTKKSEGFWEWLTVGAALLAGLGFTAQFMGLRGLAFPCSIAHLGAILIMALIRAGIRRRLGRIPAHCPALGGHELDFLATQLVFYPEVRESDQCGNGEENYGRGKLLSDFCRWKVRTAEPKPQKPFFVPARQQDQKNGATTSEPAQGQSTTPESEQHHSSITSKSEQHPSITSQMSRTGPEFKASSSQQLIRVRERLGDLCHFTSKSSESALSLAQSIELFMNSFSPFSTEDDESDEPLSHVDWMIETTKLTSTGMSEDPDSVKIPVVRGKSDGKWEVDIAKIDATLSLWMASIEAEKGDKAEKAKQTKDANDTQQHNNSQPVSRKDRPVTDQGGNSGDSSPDWRRTQVGDDLRRSFGRIIGDNLEDEVLKRDISWWVDSIVAEQSDPAVEDDNNRSDYDSDLDSYDSSNVGGDGRLWSRARSSGVDLVIGFNGDKSHNECAGPVRELGITSNGCLHTILAQHLFTSFMWTVAEFLPKNCLNPGIDQIRQEVEIEGPKEFNVYDSSFAQDWLRIKLRHRQLTKVVRKMESYGLGSTTDILLCMIPALSCRNLLPNQAILKLMPRVSSNRGWEETAICHTKLLETVKADKVSEGDRLSVGIVVASMDFLAFAYEPYDEQLKPPQDLDEKLRAIAHELLLPKFTTILEKLAPVYRRQDRHRLPYNVLNHPTGIVCGLDEDFAKNVLGFTQYHLLMFRASDSENSQNDTFLGMMRDEKGAKARDIFGWTQYHYACVSDSDEFEFEELSHEQLPSMLDNLGRSPIHFAALAGSSDKFSKIFRKLSIDGRKWAIQESGMDGMTLFHLIAKGGSVRLLRRLSGFATFRNLFASRRKRRVNYFLKHVESMSTAEAKALLAKKDIWGRQALHIASKLGHEEIAVKLLEMGSCSDELDNAGNFPVEYFVQRLKENGLESADQGRHNNDSGANDSFKNESEMDLFLKFAMEPNCRYHNGKTLLHIVVEVASDEIIRRLVREKGFDVEARDNDGRTPLHHAILSGRVSVVTTLIKDLQAKPSAKDSSNTTALMLTVRKDFIEIARALLDALDSVSVNEIDNDRKAAIHYVSSQEMVDLLIEKKCTLLATDSRGRTALHTAIERRDDVALYLLRLEDPLQVQTRPFDDNEESLLVTSCKSDFSEVVPEILKRWPEIINTGDAQYGQPPVSWACERGHSNVVEKLLQHELVDVNKIAERWSEYTPLHFAAAKGDSESLALLLKQPATELHRKSTPGETPLRLAVDCGNQDAARMLLQDHRTTPQERLRYVQEFTSWSSSVFHSIVGDILETLAETSLILEYFLHLYDDATAPEVQESINKCVGDLKRGGWERLKTPYHLAILLGDAEFVEILKEQNAPPGGLDEDNWSLVDYAKRFDRGGTLTSLVENLQPLGADMERKHKEPTTLIDTSSESIVKVTSCAIEGHDHCSKVHDVEVTGASSDNSRACIRSNHSIPPSTIFYFEVKVLRDSVDQIFGIGFCGWSSSDDQMPGWFKGSWGYHGDDGKLFIESGTGATPSSDFGDSGKFKSGDVVGVCLNVNTGQGFCTRNGKKLDMGNAFEGHEKTFKYGKRYPCVGFDVTEEGMGLQFRVNFDGSDAHPFMYKGPFEV